MSEHSTFTVEDRKVLTTLENQVKTLSEDVREIKNGQAQRLADVERILATVAGTVTTVEKNSQERSIENKRLITIQAEKIEALELKQVENSLVKKIVFGLVGTILLTVGGAIISLVIIKSK
jgi:hypothetical protein